MQTDYSIPRRIDKRPLFEEAPAAEAPAAKAPAAEAPAAEARSAKETSWCQKRYQDECQLRQHSAGALFAFHVCGYMFPPCEMVGPESLTQVTNV